MVLLLVAMYWRFFHSTFDESVTNTDNFFSSDTNTSSPWVVVAHNLQTPWSIAFLPDNSMLVTERPGTVRRIRGNQMEQGQIVAEIPGVHSIGEGGLLGIATHPDFAINNLIYLYYTHRTIEGSTINRVVRMMFLNDRLVNEEIVVDDIPGSTNHNGGRIQFGPDGYLYITTGDAEDTSQAQDIQSLAGKILRVTDEGEPVPDNPFDNLVYSYGHRNPQGIAWDSDGRLWATEHGRSGVFSGMDELNLIREGGNYGWPLIQGDEIEEGMIEPRLHSGPNKTWAPGGAVFVEEALFFTGLRGRALYKALFAGSNPILTEHYFEDFGRIRDVVMGSDGMLYIATSNTDGRGQPKELDDRIIRIDPSTLE